MSVTKKVENTPTDDAENANQSAPTSSRLSDSQRMLIEQRIANEKPSAGAAYLLCIFAGVLGAHRFYLGRKGSAIAMLILSITLVGLIVTAFWALIDLFLIPSMIKDKVDLARQKMILEAI